MVVMSSNDDVSQWKVLIVEDDRDNLSVATQLLEFYGAEVRSAENGQQGLELLAEYRPTLVLLDLSMPSMDGWQMLKRLRADPAMAHLPVIAVTAHAMDGDKQRVLEAGFNGYISKPFRITTFMEEIKRCLNGIHG